MEQESFRWEVSIIRLDVKAPRKAKTHGEIGEMRVFDDRLVWRKHKSIFGNPPWTGALAFDSITNVEVTRKNIVDGRLWVSHRGGELCFHLPGGSDKAREIAEFIAAARGVTPSPLSDEP